jgi:hypothetical protein
MNNFLTANKIIEYELLFAYKLTKENIEEKRPQKVALVMSEITPSVTEKPTFMSELSSSGSLWVLTQLIKNYYRSAINNRRYIDAVQHRKNSCLFARVRKKPLRLKINLKQVPVFGKHYLTISTNHEF